MTGENKKVVTREPFYFKKLTNVTVITLLIIGVKSREKSDFSICLYVWCL